jgi:hypothetical protein
MKFLLDNKEIYEFTDTIKKVICNEVLEDIFVEDMERRVKYIVEHKYKQCLKRLKDEWLEDEGTGSKLSRNGVQSIPTDDTALAELIFSQPDYLSRKQKDLLEKERERLKKEKDLLNV